MFDRTRKAALVVAASVMALTACAAERLDSASGDETDAVFGNEASCVTPSTGCACDDVGEEVECGKVEFQVGDEVQCMMGTRTCLPNHTWGECGGTTSTRTVKTSSMRVQALGAAASVCAKNACDPYCKETTDTPQGIDAGPGFKVTDAGLTLTPTGTFTLTTCTGITVTPVTSTTLVLATLNPTAADKLEFTAALTPSGCYPGTATPIWTIDDARSDALTITSSGSTGTLRAISAIAGPVTVKAHIGALVGQTTANVNVDVTQVDSGYSSYANLFPVTTGASESATMLYPYGETVFPLGLPPPIPQWTAPSSASAVKLTLRWVSGATYFKWSVITSENKALTIVPSTTVALAAAPRYPDIPTLAWFDFERSAKGQNVDIAVQRIVGTTRNAEVKKTIKFASSQLRGNVYYQSYGTRLTYNFAGAKDSTGITFPSGKFGAATMGIEPGATTPKVIAGQSPTSDTSGANCRVCHTASADGSTLITQKFGGSNGASMMVTNLTNAIPTNTDITARTDGTYAWPAIYPTSGFLFGNAGVQASYGSGPPPGGLDGSNSSITSSFWSLGSGSLGSAKSATYRTGGGSPKTINIPSSSWGLQAGVPVFSGTGTKIAMQHHAGQVCNGGSASNCTAEELKSGDKRSLAIMDWSNATSQASNFRVLVTEPKTACNPAFNPDAACTDVWPTFLPNDTGLVYEREVMHNGLVGGGLSDFGGTRSGCDNSGVCNNDGTKAEIWWTNITGTAQPTRLDAANGRDEAGVSYLPTGANAPAYCTVSGFYCSSNSACCSGTCTNNRCTGVGYTPLRAPGTSCTSASQCETNKCNGSGKCGCLDNNDCAGSSTCNTSTNTCSGGNYAGPPTMGYIPGHNSTVEPVLNYEPTVNPTATKAADGTTDEFYWVVFTSRRQFGNIATQDPWWSDPRHHDLSKSVSTKKLWVAAVSANPTAGTDPSFPAFYLPGQEWVSGNSKAYWVQNACKVGSTTKSAANVCDTSQDCCAGSTCKLDAPLTSPATRHCVPTNVCVAAGSSCSTSSDCCSGFLCSNGSCTDVPAIPSYGAAATYKRDFTNSCTAGFRPKWGTFEYQGTFPTGTSLTVKVRAADDEASAESATLVTVGTATTTTSGWSFLPTPAQTVDQLLTAANIPLAKPFLRVELTLTPSSNATSTPTLATWRVNSSCVPSE